MSIAARQYEGSYSPFVIGEVCKMHQFVPTAIYELAPFANTRPTATGSAAYRHWLTEPSISYVRGPRERVKARFRMLRRLPANHDGCGALAPNSDSIDAAISFIDHISGARSFTATLDDDGSAVIEFEERRAGYFADITFRADGQIEAYRREPYKPSEFFVGTLDAADTRRFLRTQMGLAF
jgi:hypothetical protein